MFDKDDSAIIQKKMRLIEILLIIGGIIGGFSLQQNNSLVKGIFIVFLISSLLYYTNISDLPLTGWRWINKCAIFFVALVVSLTLPALIIYPIIVIDGVLKYVFVFEYIILLIIILGYLYFKN